MTLMDSSDKKPLELLTPKEYSRYVMTLPARKRMEAILERSDGVQVVKAMNNQDFYITIMGIGPDDALPLLSLADVPKWIHIFDMDSWKKDRIVPLQAIEWLDRLSRASHDGLTKWLRDVDFFFLVSLIKKWLTVAVKPDDVDLVEAYDYLPPNTIDNQYFWECNYPQYDGLAKYILSILFEMDYAYYKDLLEHAMFTSEAEMEEEAYRFKKGRLEDQAIYDYYEALDVYAVMEASEITFHKQNVIKCDTSQDFPSFGLAVVSSEDLLGRAFSSIYDEAVQNYIKMELASLMNKILVADDVRLDDEEVLKAEMEKTRSLINLGLDVLVKGDVIRGVEILESASLEHIFRIGYGMVKKVYLRAKRLIERGWLTRCPSGMHILDEPWHENLELLNDRFPKFIPKGGSDVRKPVFISSLKDLHEANDILDTILCFGIVMDRLQIPWEVFYQRLWRKGVFASPQDVTIKSLVFTAVACNILRDSAAGPLELLAIDEWPMLWRKLHPERIEEKIKGWLDFHFPTDKEVNVRLCHIIEGYLKPLIRDYREEMLPFFERDEIPDPTFVEFFIFKSP